MTIPQSYPICTPRVIILTADVQGSRAKVWNDVNTRSQLATQALTNCVSQCKAEKWADFALLSLGNICSLTSVSLSPLLQGEAKYLHSIAPILPLPTSACFNSSATFLSSVHLIKCRQVSPVLSHCCHYQGVRVNISLYDNKLKFWCFDLNFGTVF